MRKSQFWAIVVAAHLAGCQPSAPPQAALPQGPSVAIELTSAEVTREGDEVVCAVKYRITRGHPEPTDRYRVEWREPKEGFAILARVEGRDLLPEGEFKGRFRPHKPFGPEVHPYQISVHQDHPADRNGLASNVVKGAG